jgi:polar amino acid transport system substrate-binding protein
VAGLSAVAALLLVSLLTVLLIEHYGQTDGSLPRVRQAGQLVVYVDPTWAPMEFKENAQLVGFDIDLARALAQELGVEAKFVELDWDWPAVADRLDRHEFDVMITTLTITNERKRRVIFVPYLEVHTVYVWRVGGSPVHSELDLVGKVIAVQKNTPGEQEVDRLAANSHLDQNNIQRKAHSAELFNAVWNGDADVTFADQPVAAYYAKTHPGTIETWSADGLAPPQRIGIALRKQDRELQGAVYQAIEKLKDNGTFESLYKRWGIGQ